MKNILPILALSLLLSPTLRAEEPTEMQKEETCEQICRTREEACPQECAKEVQQDDCDCEKKN